MITQKLTRIAAILREEARDVLENNCSREDEWAPNTEDEQLRYDELLELARLVTPPVIAVQLRPLLVEGLVAQSDAGLVILIDEKASKWEQNVTLWHEVLHLMGLTDEQRVETLAQRIANEIDADEALIPILEKQQKPRAA